ncbi:hypothetical protein GGS23DRAFT_553122 [Durotheca rogersii]|uniref:uncharacterized protein n=1 Tax=Durotheca rogersii TaxID=419775 RepID=UPI00221E5E44|nr:uncharacterized protein GGS23DRAFT_553122 [Durotheca rogersii]KAI5867009.1 hypothetical protein GGS23DRAFT_553122 [Durotheca rogersii]
MPHVQLKIEDEAAPDFAPGVVEILNSAFAPENPTPAREAAQAIDALCIEDYEKNGTASSTLWWFWDLIHDLARQVPYDSPEQDRLAAVIQALHDLPPKTVNLGEDWGLGSQNPVEIWTKFPMFGNTLYDKLNGDNDSRAPGEVQKKERRVNMQAYAARVAGLGLVPFETYAIWALVDALEGTMTPIRGAPDEVNEDPAAVEDISYKVKAAAMWIIHGGHLLYGRDEEVTGATAGPLWRLPKKEANKLRRKFRGTDGLCPLRWQLWKERFAVIRDTDALDAVTRKQAGDAYAAMDKVEKSQGA